MEERGAITSPQLDQKILNSIQEDLSSTSRNYFEELTQLRAYTMRLSRSAVSTNYIIGESTPNTIDYNNISYPIDKMREFFAHISNKLEVLLLRDLLVMKNIADTEIPFWDIIDTPLLRRVNDSITDVPVLARFKTFFLEQLLTPNTPYNKIFVRTIRDDNSISFNKRNVQKFTQSLDSAIELLAIAIYLFSGGPLRGTELTTILYKNIPVRNRSLMFHTTQGIMCITTDYYKSLNVTRREKTNVRFLPPNLSKLLIVLVTLVLPFRDYLEEHHYGNGGFNCAYLLAKGETIEHHCHQQPPGARVAPILPRGPQDQHVQEDHKLHY